VTLNAAHPIYPPSTHPPQIVQGLVWVWPDASPNAAAAAAASPLATIPENDDDQGWEPRTGWFMRDVPCSMETVVENVTVGVWGAECGLVWWGRVWEAESVGYQGGFSTRLIQHAPS